MPDPQIILAPLVRRAIGLAFGSAVPDADAIDPIIRAAANPEFGDYQANVAMSLAKTLGQKPRDVAQKILEKLEWQGVCDELPGVAGPGFINFKLGRGFLEKQAAAMAADERLAVAQPTQPQTIVVDYSGPNVAKEMHVGHLRSSVIGDAIARVLDFQHNHVIRQNHLGDWGTQFGMLIEYMAHRNADVAQGKESAGAQISDLNQLYREAKQRFDSDETFAKHARQRVVSLQAGDEDTLEAWRCLIDESKRHFNEVYHRLGVTLTDADVRAESFYNPMLADVVAELEARGLASVSDGAVCVFPPGFVTQEGNPLPLIVRKSDGGYGYGTTDLAALRYRIRELHAQRIVYVTDARQKQHFAMVFKVAEMAGWTAGVKIEHVPFGTILGEDNKPFKSRSGDTVKLADLLDEAEERAAAVIREKNPDLPAEVQKSVAHAVGIGAIKYADLCNDRIKDYVFSWDRMLSFDGNTAPYLQNAYVRIKSIFRKAEAQSLPPANSGAIQAAEPAERALALKLLQLSGVVDAVAQSLEPHRLCTFLYELASLFHHFYEKCPVLAAPDAATRDSRLALCNLTAHVLKQGLGLLGIAVIEQM